MIDPAVDLHLAILEEDITETQRLLGLTRARVVQQRLQDLLHELMQAKNQLVLRVIQQAVGAGASGGGSSINTALQQPAASIADSFQPRNGFGVSGQHSSSAQNLPQDGSGAVSSLDPIWHNPSYPSAQPTHFAQGVRHDQSFQYNLRVQHSSETQLALPDLTANGAASGTGLSGMSSSILVPVSAQEIMHSHSGQAAASGAGSAYNNNDTVLGRFPMLGPPFHSVSMALSSGPGRMMGGPSSQPLFGAGPSYSRPVPLNSLPGGYPASQRVASPLLPGFDELGDGRGRPGLQVGVLPALRYGMDVPMQHPGGLASPEFRELTTFSWEQTETTLKLYVPLRGVQIDLLRASFTHDGLEVRVLGLQGKNYIFAIRRLHKPLNPSGCYVVASKTKKNILITMEKLHSSTPEEKHWRDLAYSGPM